MKLATLGAGLLVGSALGIVIPEGIESIYETNQGNSSIVGLLMSAGFVLMLLIDTLIAPHNSHVEEGKVHTSPATHTQQPQIPHRMRSYTPLRPIEDNTHSPAKALSKTAGLTIHSFCDGIALGAASLSNSSNSLSIVVFLAVAIHKAPASLGLSTSLSAPISAFLTFFLLRLMNFNNSDSSIPGYALLFSGGTFLFVAAQATSEQLEESTNKKQFIALFLTGIITPILLSLVISD
ncbi:hypothetical protein E3Q22_03872 [Wallemia mellicola]|uniref:Zinc/iron permease n=1 Tax=Wallemia mellicola TaxID=1708541 RepID=A0A4T0MSU6_9BASI|nr:hypothetical protein E3Q23_03817 [Wallemia mellicola]TIB75733.1 hypothetical protein E3Q22_03872 [Wallemia mellicola]TIB86178.1 hypothetical protein E3Q19_04000 [Wallemia mellicola]TIB95121.1 hypothetical protein E3Q18_03951 [Wallemia mellicola]TIB96495.1 hypothetical protein E3Q17_03829 [Wallemia mellicola]